MSIIKIYCGTSGTCGGTGGTCCGTSRTGGGTSGTGGTCGGTCGTCGTGELVEKWKLWNSWNFCATGRTNGGTSETVARDGTDEQVELVVLEELEE